MTTPDLLQAIRNDIKAELMQEVLSELAPKIERLLNGNIFNFQEACEFLKVSDSTLRRLVKNDEIPHYRLRGNIYFRQWELHEFIGAQMIGNIAN
ncbi:MAG TPA: helix-turn-helix domain-containing protein [Sphingobacteriaceae bacterium]|nr:helix-turn-helix domain-containing protein [Sphingobacteriaceae bacterium]